MANSLVDHWRRHPECSREGFVESFCSTNSGSDVADVQAIWERLQTYPHIYELAAARGTLSSLNMDGSERVTPVASPPVGAISFNGWNVQVARLVDFEATGEIHEDLMEGLLAVLRPRWPDHGYVFNAKDVQHGKNSCRMHRFKQGRRSLPEALPPVACFPYRTASKHWVLYVYLSASAAPAEPRLLLYKAAAVKEAAVDWSTKLMRDTFQAPLTCLDLPSVEFGDVAVLLVASAHTCEKALPDVQEAAEIAAADVHRFLRAVLACQQATRAPALASLALADPDIAALQMKLFDGLLPRPLGPSLSKLQAPGVRHRHRVLRQTLQEVQCLCAPSPCCPSRLAP